MTNQSLAGYILLKPGKHWFLNLQDSILMNNQEKKKSNNLMMNSEEEVNNWRGINNEEG